MARLTHLDVPDFFRARCPPIVSQVAFALVCTGAAIGLRMLFDLWLPGAGPFALTMPAVLIATLFGRWLAGALTETISALYAWYFVLPIEGSFAFHTASDKPRVLVNVLAGFFVVALAEMFRRTVRRALADRETLLLELEHRVKNNFAAIASVVRLQLHNAQDETTRDALQSALGRVESFSRAHSFLYHGFDRVGMVEMQSYLGELCEALVVPLSDAHVRIDCDVASVFLPRDRAVTIGLLVNEVTTNSVKHAFGGQTECRIRIAFAELPDGYQLEVGDNGRGMTAEARPGSFGLKLINALAAQANASVQIETGSSGTSFRFTLSR
ncbi:sensor histidine kinase [Consotaella salsifontis]|uniref:histidine kinase n=1 Tax=Consotaella salsifontis TaxID=1365950 RepID=A0A1T4TEY9_9HYPH|nr:histidine kinase dimerization/phosphoacceptor domain -containing protein [Consotaella salsifontis]SKA39007.1 Two-component sensor histidine kinase, contains HisKA and HATPase domains [Consotaella salsifontis]